MRVRERGTGRGRVVELGKASRAFPSSASQDGVHECMCARGLRLHQLDPLGYCCPRRSRRHEEEVVEADSQGRQDGGVELVDRTGDERLQDPVERRLHLDRAVGEAHRERPVPRLEPGPVRLGAEGPVGVGALLEDTAHDGVSAAAGRCCAHLRGGRNDAPRQAVPAPVLARAHRAAPGRLDLGDEQRPLRAPEREL